MYGPLYVPLCLCTSLCIPVLCCTMSMLLFVLLCPFVPPQRPGFLAQINIRDYCENYSLNRSMDPIPRCSYVTGCQITYHC